MKIISVNVGQPQEIKWEGKSFRSSIFKSPVKGLAKVSFLNVDGDAQAAIEYHGGRDKAIYSYDNQYYELWKSSIERESWPPGIFGENFTTEGLTDDRIKIGNVYQSGTVIFKAIQPRIPCAKLNLPFQRKDMYSLFYSLKCYGTYFRVLEEGKLEAGDAIELIEESPYLITIADLVVAFATKGNDQELLQRILELPIFPENLRKTYTNFLIQK